MKLPSALLFTLIVASFAVAADGPKPEDLAGTYFQRLDYADRNITLILHPDGRYDAKYVSMMMLLGTAKGTWAIKESDLNLTPSEEKGGLKDFLTTLRIRPREGAITLLREQEEKDSEKLKEQQLFRRIADK